MFMCYNGGVCCRDTVNGIEVAVNPGEVVCEGSGCPMIWNMNPTTRMMTVEKDPTWERVWMRRPPMYVKRLYVHDIYSVRNGADRSPRWMGRLSYLFVKRGSKASVRFKRGQG